MLKYLRSSGFVGVVLGLDAMVAGIYFRFAAAIFVLALLIFLLDFEYDPSVRKRALMRIAGVVVIALSIIAFARYIVFPSVPLDVTTMWAGGFYDSGTNVGGIQWKPQYLDVRVMIVNRSNYDYKDLEVSIAPQESGVAVAELGQITSVPNVSFIGHSFETQLTITKVEGGFAQSFSTLDKPSILGKRVRCDNLPKHDALQIVVALVSVNSDGKTLERKPKPRWLATIAEFETIGGNQHKITESHTIFYPVIVDY